MQELQKISDVLIEQLHEFINVALEESVESAEIQAFPDEYCEGDSIWMYFDGKNKKVDKNNVRDRKKINDIVRLR